MDIESEKIIDKKIAISTLLSWLRKIGCKINPKVCYPFLFGPDFMGMGVREEVGPHEIVMLIKDEAIFSTELLEDSVLVTVFEQNPDIFGDKCVDYLDNKFLALLLHEKIKDFDSKWKLYFDTLPESVENLCDWAEFEISELQDSEMVYDAKIRAVKNKESYQQIFDVLNKYPEYFPEVTIELVEWCWKIIWTRSFMRSSDHSALIPYADCINHGYSKTSFYFVDQKEEDPEEIHCSEYDEMYLEEKGVILTCKDLYEINFESYEKYDDFFFELAKTIHQEAKTIDCALQRKKPRKNSQSELRNSDFVITVGENEYYTKNSQIMFEYGNYSNNSLLTHYGFAILDNRHDYFKLKIRLKELLTSSQTKCLNQKFDPNSLIFFYVEKNELCKELLRTLRALMWLPLFKPTSFFSQTDLNLELLVLGRYSQIMLNAIRDFPTTLEEDLIVKPVSLRHQFAVSLIQLTFRISKKKILLKHIEICEVAMTLLEKLKNGWSFKEISREDNYSELVSYFKCIELFNDNGK